MQGMLKKDFTLWNIKPHDLESVIYNIGHYLGKALVIYAMHR
jgi:glucose-6-phosphate 1-dehydrogenase